MFDWSYHALFMATGFCAGIINAVAGGGPILTLGMLSVTGIDPRIANLTSTVALSPGQLVAGFMVRDKLRLSRLGPPTLLVVIAFLGGAVGAALLLLTAATTFRVIVPWLILIATALYAASALPSIGATGDAIVGPRLSRPLFAAMSVYGGYFGGGNSFLVLALLSLTGHEAKQSGEIKNLLIAVINLGAVLVFTLSGSVDWPAAATLGLGGVLGSFVGARLYGRLSANAVRALVIIGGLMLAGWMFSA